MKRDEQDLISANWHWYKLRVKCGCEIRYSQFCTHRFVSFHIKTLNTICSIDFRYKTWLQIMLTYDINDIT